MKHKTKTQKSQFINNAEPQIERVTENYFSYSSTITYVVGTQKNRLDHFEHPKHMFKLMAKTIIAIVRNFLCT